MLLSPPSRGRGLKPASYPIVDDVNGRTGKGKGRGEREGMQPFFFLLLIMSEFFLFGCVGSLFLFGLGVCVDCDGCLFGVMALGLI